MQKPRRGEVWWFRLSRAVGAEIGAKGGPWGQERPCLVVSDDSFNRRRDRLTVAPLTDRFGREGLMSHWSVRVTPSPTLRIRFRGVIDCGQLWTVYMFPPDDPRNDFRGQCSGELTGREKIRVEDTILKVLMDEGLPVPQYNPPFPKGQVVEVLASPTSSRRFLIVSDPLFEALRQENGLGHCTVVPLEPIQFYEEHYPSGTAPVDVYPDDQMGRRKELALCQEVYTIDWQTRKARSVGHVPQRQMEDVYTALREYLHLAEP